MARKEEKREWKNGKALWGDGAEVQGPQRKVIRVESGKMQDYVRESLNLSWKGKEKKSRAKRAEHSTRAFVSVWQSLQ